MNEYSFGQIQKFNCEKIVFDDNFEIVFQDCVDEWNLIYHCSSKCVAQRNVLDKEPYFIFFTKERTKIKFDNGFFKKTKRKAFHQFRNKLNEFGYSTYDLS